jgi:hypothetical protein
MSFINQQRLAKVQPKKPKITYEPFLLFRLPIELTFIIVNYIQNDTLISVYRLLNTNTKTLVDQYCHKTIKNKIKPLYKHGYDLTLKFYVTLQHYQHDRSSQGKIKIEHGKISFTSYQYICGGCSGNIVYQENNCDLIYYKPYSYDNIVYCHDCGNDKGYLTKMLYQCGTCFDGEITTYRCMFGCIAFHCTNKKCKNFYETSPYLKYGCRRIILICCSECKEPLKKIKNNY